MEKTLIELKNLLQKRELETQDEKKLTCVGLTAKKNLCVHKDSKGWRQTERVETECRKRTARWVRMGRNA
jgi:DNA excision repair protein ERCC-2